MRNHVGQQLGKYRLLQHLGSGGFADVYLGEHVQLKKLAAIKVFTFPVSIEETPDFLKEARIIAALEHPHIIQVFDCDVEKHSPFLAMTYASGGTLRQRYPKGSRLPLETVREYARQAADALQYAHTQKIIHRDIKPENLLLGQNDKLLVSDFGIALIAHSSQLQRTQEVMGTWAYMAPEQFLGKPCFASDQYSLGIVVYEWLCGERPFLGTAPELYSQHLHASPPPLLHKLPELSPAVEQVVMKAIEKAPEKRFESVQAFASALEQASGSAVVQPNTRFYSLYLSPTQFAAPLGQQPLRISGNNKKTPWWSIGKQQYLTMLVGVLLSCLYNILWKEGNQGSAYPLLFQFSITLFSTLFFAILSGPWLGLLVAGISAMIYIDLHYIAGSWMWSIVEGAALGGFVAGLAQLKTRGHYRNLSSFAITVGTAIIGVASFMLITDIFVYNNYKPLMNFTYPANFFNILSLSIETLIILPILLVLFNITSLFFNIIRSQLQQRTTVLSGYKDR